MSKTLIAVVGSIAAVFILTGCTQQSRAKSWGGSAKIELPAGQKIVGATWKESNLWYMTRPARSGEFPETVTLQESSNLGVVEGKVIFQEH